MTPRKPGGGKTRPGGPPSAGKPQFGQPTPSPDPTGFRVPVTDDGDYSKVNPTLLQPVPQPRGASPVLTLQEIYGSTGAAKLAAIERAGQIVFHAVGDTGIAIIPHRSLPSREITMARFIPAIHGRRSTSF
jgi:hypothetical protein